MDNIEELDTASPLDLIVETGMLRLDKAHLTAELVAVKAELASQRMANEDLCFTLEEACNRASEWCQTAPEQLVADRIVARWRRQVEAAQ